MAVAKGVASVTPGGDRAPNRNPLSSLLPYPSGVGEPSTYAGAMPAHWTQNNLPPKQSQ